MPHIHERYDFVVSAFIVCRGRVLLVHHKRYREWLPIGGHVELDEDPEEALYREIREESGLKVKILSETPKIAHRGVKPLPTPAYMDAHRISPTHKHVAFVYFAVSKSDRVRLHEREHHEFRWFERLDLVNKKFKVIPSIRFYCRRALTAASALVLLFFAGAVWAAKTDYPQVIAKENGMTEFALDPALEGGAHLEPDARLDVLGETPFRFSLQRGEFWILNEKSREGGIELATEHAQIFFDLGGAWVSTSALGTEIRAFSGDLKIVPTAFGRGISWLHEGFKMTLTSKTRGKPARMIFQDYEKWQEWIKRHYERKDGRELGRIRREMTG